jgi:GntR family transcriptional regulator
MVRKETLVMIDKNSPIPIYYQLKENIKQNIAKGVWKAGQCIDSERELSEQYEVSRMTIRQALGELVHEGILVREKGKGTFVCDPKVKQRDMMSFSETIEKSRLSLETKVLSFKRISTPHEMQEVISFDEVYLINRLRIVEGVRVANEIVYIPCDYCGYMDEEVLKGSLYRLIESYGYSIDHSEASISAIVMDEYYKELFQAKEQLPLIKIYSKNITSDGRLLFLEESVYRSDKYILEVNILRKEGKLK